MDRTEPLRLRTLLGDHPNTLALKQGEVRSDLLGFDFDDAKVAHKAFKRVVRDLEFDVAELAIMTFLMAKHWGKPLVLLPAVLMARFQHPYLVYNAERRRLTPRDLAGRRVGIRSYSVTTATWIRAILANDYGGAQDSIRWVSFEDAQLAENLAVRPAVDRGPPAVARQRGDALRERAGRAAARSRPAGKLSGGMRQKLGVIASMLHQPDLLVLDEPTTGVDPVSRADLWWLIARAAAGGAAGRRGRSSRGGAERAAAALALEAGRELAGGTRERFAAARRGTLRGREERPAGEAGRRAWRRAGRWRVWDPDGQPPGTGGLAPDLQDAVTVAALARELAGSQPGDVQVAGGEER